MRVFNNIFFVFLLLSASTVFGQKNNPQSIKGILNLSNWDFEKTSYLPLDGEWEIYWDKLYTPSNLEQIDQPITSVRFPQIWNNTTINGKQLPSTGKATYRLRIQTPDNLPVMAISIPDCYTSYKMWVNGRFFAANGIVGKDKASTTPYWLPITKAIDSDTTTFEIVLQVANFHHSKGGFSEQIYFGTSETLTNKRERELAYDLILTGCLIMGGLFFLGLFLFGRHDTAMLYFALFCLVFSYRKIGTGHYFLHQLMPQLPSNLTMRLEYISLYVSVLFFVQFMYKLFPEENYKKITRTLQIIALLSCALVLVSPPYIFTQSVNYFLIYLAINLPYGLFVFVRASINGKKEATYAILSILSLFIAVSLIILDYFNIVAPMYFLVFLCEVAFFFFQSLILSYRFSESLKKAAEAANEGARSKSEFLATMSHEIRTPMNGVIGMTSLLSQTKLSEEQKGYVETIRLSGENLITIINDILDFSKIESGKLRFENLPFELESSIEEIFSLFSEKANLKGLSLNYQIDYDVPSIIVSDPTRLKQIIINLVSNAVKFTDNGDVFIHISTKNKTEKNTALQFTISDTGIGIPANKIDTLFKQFSQVDSSTSRKYGGTGLGLAICKQLVNLMGGTISVESEENNGTTFSFTLNVDLPEHDQKPFGTKIPELSNQKVILFCENDGLERVIKHQLTYQSALVQISPTKEELLLSLREDQYKIIILCCINDNTSTAIIDNIQNINTYKNTPILIITDTKYKLNLNKRENIYPFSKPLKQSSFRHTLSNVAKGENIEQIIQKQKVSNQKLADIYPLRILVAEDHAINQKLIIFLLQKRGYTIDMANDGLEAVEAVQRQDYDLIFMDIQMPNMDGLEATRRIVSMFDKPKCPIIIAMTANVMEGDREKCLEAGMNDYVSKPLKSGIITEMIKKWAPSKIN